MDWLRDSVNSQFEEYASKLLADPWAARDDSIALSLDKSENVSKEFFVRHQAKRLTPSNRAQAVALLEMQRHLMLMYSSCGWFFDDISGVEATMLLQQAGWVIAQARSTFKVDLLDGYLERIAQAQSNDTEAGNGAQILRRVCPEL
jgi:alpha-amylase/alpha-mannosidase (GH57 family)